MTRPRLKQNGGPETLGAAVLVFVQFLQRAEASSQTNNVESESAEENCTCAEKAQDEAADMEQQNDQENENDNPKL